MRSRSSAVILTGVLAITGTAASTATPLAALTGSTAFAAADTTKAVTGLTATVTAPGTVKVDWDDAPGFDPAIGEYRITQNGTTFARRDVSDTTRSGLTGDSYTYAVYVIQNGVQSPKAEVTVTGVQGGSTPTPTNPFSSAKPPALTNPITVTVSTAGNLSQSMVDGQDYIVKLPSTPVDGDVILQNGDDVVVQGGAIYSRIYDQPALEVKSQTGSVYVEGVVIGNPDAPVGQDGIVVDERSQKPGSKVTFVNVKVNKVLGSEPGNHGDVIQVYGGSADTEIVLEKLDGTTQYQGLMWQPTQFGVNPAKLVLDEVVLRHSPDHNGGYLVYKSSATVPVAANDTKLVNGSWYTSSSRPATGVENVTSASSPLVGAPGLSYVPPNGRIS